jgi:hypothetical protein
MGKFKSYLRFVKNKWFIAAACFIFGALVVLGIRFVIYKPDTTHYHANFALYINGQREQFKSQMYYEETEMCSVETTMTPSGRAHMHDNVNNVVHVEDHAVTWGQFFTNLGWYMGSNFIEGPGPNGTMYQEDGNSQLHLILNGQDYTDLGGFQNTVIKDQDKLLVSFGDLSNATLQQEYKAVPSTAHHYDVTQDPASCMGGHASISVHDRLTHLF